MSASSLTQTGIYIFTVIMPFNRNSASAIVRLTSLLALLLAAPLDCDGRRTSIETSTAALNTTADAIDDSATIHFPTEPTPHRSSPRAEQQIVDQQPQSSYYPPAIRPPVPIYQRQPAAMEPQYGSPFHAVFQPQRNAAGNANSHPSRGSNVFPSTYLRSSAEANNVLGEPVIEFAWNLFRSSKTPSRIGNLVLSPLMLQTTLALLQTAATGPTFEQIGRVVEGVKLPQLQALQQNIVRVAGANGAQIQLGLAAAIFVDHQLGLNGSFVREAQGQEVDVRPVDFADADGAALAINNWAANATRNNIRKLLQAESVRDARVLLANAIYFRGLWKFAFNTTEPGKFYVDGRTEKDVTFMRSEQLLRIKDFATVGGNHAHWVELPYKGNDISMILIVPSEPFGLEQLIRTMSGSDVSDIINMLTLSYRRLVDLRMPKFDIQTSFSLVNTLLKMGLVDPFTVNSQLPYLIAGRTEPIKLDDILQKAQFRCDELGSEATVVQAVSVVTLSISDEPLKATVNIDRPFLALIVDRVNRVPLFMAKIYEP